MSISISHPQVKQSDELLIAVKAKLLAMGCRRGSSETLVFFKKKLDLWDLVIFGVSFGSFVDMYIYIPPGKLT
jgi:Fe2+ transport system protein FeoA